MYRDALLERHLPPLLAIGTLVVLMGTSGYVLIEGWSVFDALYMTVITVSTVGFHEVQPLSRNGRIFTMIVTVGGLAALWYTLSVLVAIAVEGNLTQKWSFRKMEQQVQRQKDHQIVCGYGRVGRQTAIELSHEGESVVVVDIDEAPLKEAQGDGYLTVHGNATEDDVLAHAGIERAAGLITAVATDADNIFVTLTARAMNPHMPIVARANFDDAASKLERAGATQVISPYAMAGRQMARLAIRPSNVEFVETLLQDIESDMFLEDIRVSVGSSVDGTRLADLRRAYPEATFLAVQRDGRMASLARGNIVLQPEDTIAVVGDEALLATFSQACQNPVETPDD